MITKDTKQDTAIWGFWAAGIIMMTDEEYLSEKLEINCPKSPIFVQIVLKDALYVSHV